MAITITKLLTCLLLTLIITFCSVLGQEAHPTGVSENGKSVTAQLREYIHHRKMLLDMEMQSHGSERNGVEDELRTVPAGPDPLHHNGAPPKKPTSSP